MDAGTPLIIICSVAIVWAMVARPRPVESGGHTCSFMPTGDGSRRCTVCGLVVRP